MRGKSRLHWLMMTTILGTMAVPAAAQEVVLSPVTLTGTTTQGYVARSSATASKSATPLEKTPASVSVVTEEQMADQAVHSVAEAMRYTPGVASEYRGASNVSDETYIRGFGYVPRFLDGLSFGVSGSHVQMDPWLLASVEVLKGPASVLYGQASPGGIINMTSKLANGETINHVVAETGTGARAGLKFDFASPLAGTDWSWRLVGLAENVDTQEEGLRVKRYMLAPSVTWAPSDATRLTINAMAFNEPFAGFRNFRQALGTLYPTVHGLIPADFLVGDPDYEIYERSGGLLGYRFEHRFDNGVTFRQNARYGSFDTHQQTLVWGRLLADERTITRTITDSRENARQFALDNQVELRAVTGAVDHAILLGLDLKYSEIEQTVSYGGAVSSIDWLDPVYGRDNISVTLAPNSTDARTRASQHGVYVQDQMTIGRLNAVAGLRYDWTQTRADDYIADTRTDFDSEALTGRFGAIYDAGHGLSPYFSYSTSFEPVLQAPLAGEAPFDPTRGEQWEVGVKWVPAGWDAVVTTSLYDLRQKNVLKSVTGTTPTVYEQVGEIKSRGFELEGRANVTEALSLLASYSYNDSRISQSNNPDEIGTHNDRVPRHQASIWGKYAFRSGFDLRLGVRYVGESWARGNSFTVPGVTLVDMAVGYDFGRMDRRYEGLRAQLNVANLFDEVYTASCASAYACFIGTERVVTASLDYRW